jgi:hypothetical protein
MTLQEIAAYLIGAAALVWLVVRYRRRRATGNCCGEAECPAAKSTVDLIRAHKSEAGGR